MPVSDLGRPRREALSYLLTEYDTNSPLSSLQDAIFQFLGKRYASDYIDIFWEGVGDDFRTDVVDEYNRRLLEGGSLRFALTDDVGDRICGSQKIHELNPAIAFQDALQLLSPAEFESLAGLILRIAGCDPTWVTPASHDQGLDGFGYAPFLFAPKLTWPLTYPRVIFLAQAKHYIKGQVDTEMVREFVGSCTLSLHNVYAVHKDKHKQLEFKALSPVALVYLTSGEVSRSAKTLAHYAGIVMLASDEIYALFSHHWEQNSLVIPTRPEAIAERLREDARSLRTAQ